VKRFLFVIVPISLLVLQAWKIFDTGKTITWCLKDTRHIGKFSPIVLGDPLVKVEGKDSSIYFNGVTDGLVIPAIPIEGWAAFTIEVLFKPDSDGPRTPRFIHFEDTALNRGTFELRLTNNGQWYYDGFLKNGKTNRGLTLSDSLKLHPADRWYWAALAYDGRKMYSYINGQKELEGEIDFPPLTKGNISLGVRLNKVNWFKGQIREIRFHPEALQAKSLQRL
jgi:Concanavalin A-like lectin/glucanases superfamily